MAVTTTTTANMGLVLPLPSVEIGPTWAIELNAALTDRVDAHDHSSGWGVKVTPSGLNISSDLSFGSNNATTLRAARFDNQGSVLGSVGDVREVYVKGGDLYYNNNSGTAVQITSGATLNSGALVANVYEQLAVSTNLTINPALTYVMLRVDTSAARTITLPAPSPGRFYIIKDATGSAQTNNITLNAAAGDNIDGASSVTLRTNYGSWTYVSDGTHRWNSVGVPFEIDGLPVSTAAPAAGNGLYATSATALAFSALNLAGGSNYVSGVLPSANMFQATTGTSGAVKLAGDFDSTSTAAVPRISNLTGNVSDNAVTTSATSISFNSGLAGADILQAAGTGSAEMRIQAQSSSVSTGGKLTLCSGDAQAGAPQLDGIISLKIGGSSGRIAVQGVELGANRNVTALAMNTTDLASANVPTGNRVVYIGNAGTIPSTAPTSGALVFSSSGDPTFMGANSGGNAFGIVGTTSGSAGAFLTYLNVVYNGAAAKIQLYNP